MSDAKDSKQTALQQLQSAPFFVGLPAPAVQKALAQLITRHHPAEQIILLENDWGSSVYFVLNGWLKIRTFNMEGKEITLNILGVGEMFGEMSPLDQTPRSTDVLTLTEATIASIPASAFMELLATEPQAGIHLARLLARRLRQLNRRIRLREADSTCRIADLLLFLAESQGKATPAGVVIPNLPHRELSSLSGLARETVTRVLGKLEKNALIRRDPEKDLIYIPNLTALEDIVS